MSAFVDCIDDPTIPALRAVFNPPDLGEHLRQALPSQTEGLKEIKVRLLRHHVGKRCVVEITLATMEGVRCLIGKAYAKDRSDVYRLMEEISRAGFDPCEGFSIPRPTAYLQALQLLLQEKVEGRPATESFLSNNECERMAAAERCARWLAKFHALAHRVGASTDLGSHLLSIEGWHRRLASMGEPFAHKAHELFRRLEAAASGLQPTEMCTIHGDYSHHQVIFAQGRTVTCDWDSYRLADSSRDVARFIVSLQRLALSSLGSIRALDSAAEVFLNTYVAIHRLDLTKRLAFQKAAVCLEHAKHDVHKQAQGWRERAEETLDQGLRVLEVAT